MKYILPFLLILNLTLARTQTLTDSNLPIVIINTDLTSGTGQPRDIPDAYKVGASMKIIFRPDSSRNYVADQNTAAFLNYNGRIGIETRGSSSQTLPKKPYGLTTFMNDNVTNNNVSILGMPPENDWILNSIAFDPSLIRNFLSYDLARSMGNYAPRGAYCEVIINGNYKGLYIFMEKIKIDKGRVNISKMTKYDNANPELTGGYILKADKTTGGDPVAWTLSSYSKTTDFLYENPKPNEITWEQSNFIKSQFTNLQSTASAQNSSIVNGYPSIIDIPSFVDYMIMSELASNADSYQYSTYFHKERGGKLRAGPVWDYDLTYGNDLFIWGLNRSFYNVWQFNNGDNTGAKFWKDLYDTPTFRCYLVRRWNNLNSGNGPLSYQVIEAKIDKIIKLISEAIPRENSRWGNVGGYLQNVDNMKSWLQSRINWLNTNLSNYQSCANPTVPSLVISKIHYNPKDALGHDSEDLEFIEIANNGNQTANLTGVHFRDLGLTYQFPANATLPAGDRLYLANNAISFLQFYGFPPFGEFTRSLSDSTERIILADAFGNTIDSVNYQNSSPWPAQANGTGYYLSLTDLNSNNSVASNWSVSTITTLGVSSTKFNSQINVFPNPVRTTIKIESGKYLIVALEVTDIRGRRIIYENGLSSNLIEKNIEHLTTGVYLVRITLENGETVTEKVTKIQ